MSAIVRTGESEREREYLEENIVHLILYAARDAAEGLRLDRLLRERKVQLRNDYFAVSTG
jgi:hypothetical protein